MCEGESCGFLAAGKDLQELGERLGLRIREPERARG
jgi:predicted small metal-binding protein